MVFIDGTVVNVALPAIQADLGITVVAAQWIVEAYALFLASLVLVGGSLGDRFGRRRVFSIGVALFAVASVGCALAPTAATLIAGRSVQGIAGALLAPGSLAIISATFDEGGRGRAIGTWSSFTAMTAALGPLLGGWLVDQASWRMVFFLNVPLAAIVLAIAFTRVPESRDEDASHLDWLGAILATVGLGGTVYGLIESGAHGFQDPLVRFAIVGGILTLVLFVFVESRVREPMLPLGLFRSRSFVGANLLTFLVYAGLAGGLFFLPFNLIQVQGYSATAAGAALLPFVLMVFALSRWSGSLVPRVGTRLLLTVGPTLAAASAILYAVPGVGDSYWTTFFPAVVLQGIGMGITIAPLSTTVMGAVDVRHAGVASGVNNAVSRIAGLLAVAVMGIVALTVFSTQLHASVAQVDLPPPALAALDAQLARLAGAEVPPELDSQTTAVVHQAIDTSFVAAYRVVMLFAGALTFAGALVALIMIDGAPRRGTG
jgi:EmrB/QacA subfamily drug resistance transporter